MGAVTKSVGLSLKHTVDGAERYFLVCIFRGKKERCVMQLFSGKDCDRPGEANLTFLVVFKSPNAGPSRSAHNRETQGITHYLHNTFCISEVVNIISVL